MRQELLEFLQVRYGVVKSEYAGEGRRRWQIRALRDFWKDPAASLRRSESVSASSDEILEDLDPFDYITKDAPELGILLRTDFTDENAWKGFIERLEFAEREFAAALKEQASTTTDAVAVDGDAEMDGPDSEDSEDEDNSQAPIIKVVNLDSPQKRALVTNLSNLAALRLLNDVDIRAAPDPPSQAQRIAPPNPLIDYHQWQEIYSGLGLWIYDSTSNTDQCARQISQEGHVYGTATGDSWRARVSHICELQFNMSCLGMKIDFGELDRWDHSERKRNLDEAALPIS